MAFWDEDIVSRPNYAFMQLPFYEISLVVIRYKSSIMSPVT